MPYESELAFFRSRVNELHGATLARDEALPEGAIRHLVEGGPFSHLDEAALTVIVRELEGAFVTRQRRGSIIVSNARPWLVERKPGIDFYYWNRLRRFYLETGVLPAHVLATLDHDTDQVLDQCGDPTKQPAGARRGMVMGHVQSGKTTNYSALICKAADAGYKVIILLAGITNSLRAQTQERLDETFIGKRSVFGPVASEPMPIQNFAGTRRIPSYGTTRDADFVSGREGVFFTLSGHSEPVIFVTKKNKGVLERLRDWLDEQEDAATFPLLLIDDEADNASINTAKDPRRTTAINGVIREILGRFPRSAYVGYTATPFANIFIDPDTPADMETDDLFPRHFIKALDPPTNYVGSRRVFWEQGDLRQPMVRVVDDYRGVLPLSHKAGELPGALPGTLQKAIRVFCLTRAIRVLRGQGRKHCSMMVNVSRFNAVQDAVHGLIYEYLTLVRDAVTVHAGLPGGGDDPVMRDLRETFGEEFGGLGLDWDQVLPALLEAVSSVQTRVVNMKGGVLDYTAHREHGLHVVAVGGLALSRGLTLEGLTVSYILRNTAASDTLMQMARWFGYRPGYEDVCRLYLPKVSLDHYEDVDDATDELRREVKRMERLRMTPADFGLKVRQSQLALRVTAANKMRHATVMTIAQDYGARHVEGHALVNSAEVNARKAIFSQVLADLRAIGGERGAYELLALSPDAAGGARLVATLEPRDFIICAEEFGVPQARHRVIIIGVRRDAVAPAAMLSAKLPAVVGASVSDASPAATVRHVLAGLPELRSGLSKADAGDRWNAAMLDAIATVAAATAGGDDALQAVHAEMEELRGRFSAGRGPGLRSADGIGPLDPDCPAELSGWLLDPRLIRLSGHSSRGHMESDLARYLFVSSFAKAHGRSPVAREFPPALAPAHRNWDTGDFADRFRAQHWDAPSRTVTSHIAKDGHYFIHPDPAQCRALTVREAARLQTFPDNYQFLGNRTQQFVQVGNAVPPLLARRIGMALHGMLSGGSAASDELADDEARDAAQPSDGDAGRQHVLQFGGGASALPAADDAVADRSRAGRSARVLDGRPSQRAVSQRRLRRR